MSYRQENKYHAGIYKQKSHMQDTWSNISTLLSIPRASTEVLYPVFGTVLQESGEGPKESNENNQKPRKDNQGKDWLKRSCLVYGKADRLKGHWQFSNSGKADAKEEAI